MWQMWLIALGLAALTGLFSLFGSAQGAAAASIPVPRGSTLDQLSALYGVSVQALVSANGISDPNLIFAGSDLLLPSTSESAGSDQPTSNAPTQTGVIVLWGQTLWSLASRWGTTVGQLASANGISNPNYIRAGQLLTIPTGSQTSSPSGTSPAVNVSTSSDTYEPSGQGESSTSPSEPVSTQSGPTASVVSEPISGTLPALLLGYPDRVALRPLFQYWSAQFGVPSPLLESMCWWESGWQQSIVSPTGAVGIGQLEPGTVLTLRQTLGDPGLDPWIPSDNIEMAAAYLSELLQVAGGNQGTALAYYYQGARSVQAQGMIPATRNYVDGILAYSEAFSW